MQCDFLKFVGLLAGYLSKLIPVIGKLIETHLIIRLCEFVKFEGLLACYISELIPVMGKLIGTHLTIASIFVNYFPLSKWKMCLLNLSFRPMCLVGRLCTSAVFPIFQKTVKFQKGDLRRHAWRLKR